jgi:hypothetical protein
MTEQLPKSLITMQKVNLVFKGTKFELTMDQLILLPSIYDNVIGIARYSPERYCGSNPVGTVSSCWNDKTPFDLEHILSYVNGHYVEKKPSVEMILMGFDSGITNKRFWLKMACNFEQEIVALTPYKTWDVFTRQSWAERSWTQGPMFALTGRVETEIFVKTPVTANEEIPRMLCFMYLNHLVRTDPVYQPLASTYFSHMIDKYYFRKICEKFPYVCFKADRFRDKSGIYYNKIEILEFCGQYFVAEVSNQTKSLDSQVFQIDVWNPIPEMNEQCRLMAHLRCTEGLTFVLKNNKIAYHDKFDAIMEDIQFNSRLIKAFPEAGIDPWDQNCLIIKKAISKRIGINEIKLLISYNHTHDENNQLILSEIDKKKLRSVMVVGAMYGSTEVMDYLIDLTGDVNYEEDGESIISLCARRLGFSDVNHILDKYGDKINPKIESHNSGIYWSIRYDKMELIQKFVSLGFLITDYNVDAAYNNSLPYREIGAYLEETRQKQITETS